MAHLAARIRKIALQDPFFSSQNAQREGRKAFVRKWRFRHRAVADSLEAGDRLFSFTRLPLSQWKSARTTRSSVCTKSSKGGSRRRTVLPSAEIAAMLFWPLMASGQISMRKIDGWRTLATKQLAKKIYLAA
ncbi:hypothetical protein FHR88_005979 [Bradyrhizobium betae]|nr:hypothetical protein [Bradyrhizobium betae]